MTISISSYLCRRTVDCIMDEGEIVAKQNKVKYSDICEIIVHTPKFEDRVDEYTINVNKKNLDLFLKILVNIETYLIRNLEEEVYHLGEKNVDEEDMLKDIQYLIEWVNGKDKCSNSKTKKKSNRRTMFVRPQIEMDHRVQNLLATFTPPENWREDLKDNAMKVTLMRCLTTKGNEHYRFPVILAPSKDIVILMLTELLRQATDKQDSELFNHILITLKRVSHMYGRRWDDELIAFDKLEYEDEEL